MHHGFEAFGCLSLQVNTPLLLSALSSPVLEINFRIFHPNPFRSFYMQQMAQYDPPEIEQEPGCQTSGLVDWYNVAHVPPESHPFHHLQFLA